MILQALVQHYEDLAAKDKIARPGWGPAKVSYALEINDNGDLVRVFSVMTEQQYGKKNVFAPQIMTVPAPVKRTAGFASNFLCDNSSYMLGATFLENFDSELDPSERAKKEEKQNKQIARAKECFFAARKLHTKLLSNVDNPTATAVVRFFEKWEPENAIEHPAFIGKVESVFSGTNLVFYHNGFFAHTVPELQSVWQAHYSNSDNTIQQVCLVTGKEGATAQLHPTIKGIQGAQSTGASLVSFNAPAFCSYNKEQGQNAPTSEYAAFAYGAALNHLIADREHTVYIGDTIVLFWAKGGETEYQDAFGEFALGDESQHSNEELNAMLCDLCKGKIADYNGIILDPECEFYILGIAPNAARLAVRFFWKNSFGALLKNMEAHRTRLEIVRPEYDNYSTLPLWKLLAETVNQNSRDKTPSPVMAGDVLRAVLNNAPYPATLLNGVVMRIRAERDVTRGRAAIIKAYYLRNRNPDVPEEVLTVALNRDTTNVPYVLGRLFSVLEDIQHSANPGISSTIKDKYFNSASSTPATIFPILLNLTQKHLRKLDIGIRIYNEKRLGEITDILPDEFPARLSLPQQGAFQLGYYHQTQARYQK